MEDILARLDEVPLFASLSELNKHRLAELIQRTTVPRGATIVHQGDMGTTFFIINAGEIVAMALDERGEQTPPRFLQPGDSWGETSLLVGEPRDATMRVRRSGELLYLQKRDFDTLIEQHPSIWDELDIRQDVLIKLTAPRFPWLSQSERVEWYGRKHWLVFFRTVAAMLLVWMLALVAIVLFGSGLPGWELGLIAVAMLLLISPWLAWAYVDWRNDFHVVTNRRVVHVEKVLFQYQSRIEAPLDKVQNIAIEQGLLGNVLDFAQMRITTAGAQTGQVPFRWVYDPELVNRIIVEQTRRFKLQQRSKEYEEIAGLLEERLNPAEEEPDIPDPEDQDSPQRIDYDPLALMRRTEGCARVFRDTAVYSFLRKPHWPRFKPIKERDSIIWRKHWLILVVEIAAPSLVFLATLVVSIYLLVKPPTQGTLLLIMPAAIVALGAAFFWLAYRYEDWRNDLYVVTNTHIIDIERTPFLANEKSRQASLDNIQDIRFEIPGFWASVVSRGDVVIETAGQGEFTFDSVQNPSAVQREIFNRIEAMRQRKQQADRQRRESEMAEWFNIYHNRFRDQAPTQQPAESSPQEPLWTGE